MNVVPTPSSIPIVVNEAAVKQYWSGGDPVGTKGALVDPKGTRFHVVGVAGDVRSNGLDRPADPEIYLPAYYARVEGMRFVIRSAQPPAAAERFDSKFAAESPPPAR